MLSSLLFVVAVPVFIFSFLCSGSDTLLQGQSLFPNQTLVSKGGKFELGFFSPDSSNNYYIGIWYKNIPVKTVVWVLNRANPIPYSSYNDSRIQLWFGGLLIRPIDASWEEGGSSNISEAVILDTGNFVLRTGSGVDLWQSFDYPTDTWLPGMKLNGREMLYYYNNNYYYYRGLLSWMNPNDPSPGNYSLRPDGKEVSTRILINRSEILWRSGALQGGGFSSLHDYSAFSTSYNFSYFPSSSSTADYDGYIVYNVYNESLLSRIVIDYLGRLMHYGWSEARRAWVVLSCSAHPSCRPNTICDVSSCKCLDAFVPRVQQDWDSSVFSDGCKRMRPLDCSEGKIKFINVTTARLPANSQSRKFTNDVCNLACSGDCSCTAYYYAHDHGDCLLFMGDLSSLEGPSNISVGVDLHLKQESTHHTAPTTAKLLVIILPIASVLLISCCCFFYMWPKLKNKEYEVTHQDLLRFHLNPNERQGSVGKSDPEEKTSQYELPIFSFSSIAASTNNFSIANKLGQGGFGPVYKGALLNGQFVAVKRLSMRSGQGLEEFSNETKLIAKLQHRNLVEILGCCNENDEMILVYEYMPNQSLDIFLFEPTKKEVLDWKRRVRIIEGIAQGLLYLHHHSRLKIVHRDLKASNILLDAEMNPKISDFGMARIFGGNELQENTKRIVGTYGYMSPEYAMEGLFSVKSDMFAFGVLMLEIITGKKNVGFYGSDSLSLLRYAWDLWKNDSAHELIDPMLEISDSSSSILALRYIQISLLCVEENPAERPLISDVVGMLNNEKKPIGSPKNPAFTVGRSLVKATPAQHRVEICSVNDLTLSNVEAR